MTGIILAGGNNTRIGTNKAFLTVDGKPIIEKHISIFKELFDEVLIAANDDESYKHLGVTVVKDTMPGRNSLGGIYSGIIEARNEYCFITACDMPFLKRDLILYLMNKRYHYDAVVPVFNNSVQPLCAVYSKKCIEYIEKQLVQNNLKIIQVLGQMNVHYIPESIVRQFDTYGASFININTPADYMRYKEGIQQHVCA